MGEVKLSFVDYFANKKLHLHLDIVEYPKGGPQPLYNLIIGKQTLHDIGAALDFKERTITIDDILLPMRNISLNLAFSGHLRSVLTLPRSQRVHMMQPNAW